MSLAALYHPLRLAEEVALLDVLTGGRINWGAGRGFEPGEFAAFGVPIDETAARFREAVEVVLAAWTTERLTFHGRFWDFDGVEVLPKPVQQPHPPTWVAATSTEAIRWSASVGPADPDGPACVVHRDRRRSTSSTSPISPPTASPRRAVTPMARLVAVAETDAAAEEIARAGAAWTIGAYAHDGTVAIVVRRRRRRASRATSATGSCGAHRHACATSSSGCTRRCTSDYLMIAPLSNDSFLRFTDDVLTDL